MIQMMSKTINLNVKINMNEYLIPYIIFLICNYHLSFWSIYSLQSYLHIYYCIMVLHLQFHLFYILELHAWKFTMVGTIAVFQYSLLYSHVGATLLLSFLYVTRTILCFLFLKYNKVSHTLILHPSVCLWIWHGTVGIF